MTRSRQCTTAERALELPLDRAFVQHLDARAHVPRRVIGRPSTSCPGRMTHAASMRELMAFLADFLRQPGGRRTDLARAESEENA